MKHKHYGCLDLSAFKYICVCIISFLAKVSTAIYKYPSFHSNSMIVVPVVNTFGDSVHIFHQSKLAAIIANRECHVILTPTSPASDVATVLFEEKYIHYYNEPLYLIMRSLIPAHLRRSSIDHLILYHLRVKFRDAGYAWADAQGNSIEDIFGVALKEDQPDAWNAHLKVFMKSTPQYFIEFIRYSRLLNSSLSVSYASAGMPDVDSLKRQLGINSPYVCMHIKETMAGSNCLQPRSIKSRETYKALINLIVSRGYTVVEIGASHSSRAFSNTTGYVNYANSELQSIVNDIQLIRGCEFYIGNNSGPWSIALMHRKPLLMLNFTALSIATVKTPLSLYLIKKILDKNKLKLMSIEEYMDSDFFYHEDSAYFSLAEKGYAIEDNTEAEIFSAAEEFLERLDLYLKNGSDSSLNNDQQETYLRKINPSHLCLYESRALLAKANFIR